MALELRVGPFTYRVMLVSGHIEHEGEMCLGLCDNERLEMLISDRCAATQRLQVISHEYMEAWYYHFGQHVGGKEGWCDLFGLAMTQFVMDVGGGKWLRAVIDSPAERPQVSRRSAKSVTASGRPGDKGRETVSVVKVSDEVLPDIDPAGGGWRLRVYEPGNETHHSGQVVDGG